MSIIRRTGILALALVLAIGGGTALAKGSKNKGDREHHVRGTVTAVDSSSITVKTRKGESKQFRITSTTAIERLGKHGEVKPAKEAKAGKKGKRGIAAKIRRIKTDSHVAVTVKGDVVEKISVKRKGRKGKSS